MLTSSCPQCRHEFPVGVSATNVALPLTLNPERQQRASSIDQRTIGYGCETIDHPYDSETIDNTSENSIDWMLEDDSMEQDATNYDTLVTFREHVSTKRPISNRLSLSGGGLITINKELEPIEPITPVEDCYNPLKSFGNPAFRNNNVDEMSGVQSSNSLKRIHHKPETLNVHRLRQDDSRRDSRRESKVQVTAADRSQISPSTPLTFVLPVIACHANPRPTSHILLTQKSEILPSTTMTDFRVVYPMPNARPASLQIETFNPNLIDKPFVNLYLLPWQQQDALQDSQNELNRLELLSRRLKISCWYYDNMTWQRSEDLLKNTKPGTFLVRNSSDPNYLYSLSVQTKMGPTSIRLSYVNGAFCLDSQRNLQQTMPKFTCIIKLIEYYINFTLLQESNNQKIDTARKKLDNKVWMDSKGAVHSEIILKKPLYKEVPSLKHLSRMKIHDAINSNGQPKLSLLPGYNWLELPKVLVEYLAEYPYAH